MSYFLPPIKDLYVSGTIDGGVIATGSTASRSLDDRFAEIMNPKDYGAVGDGVHDDTDALNAFFAQAGTKHLHLAAGTYKITSALTAIVGTGIKITGDGPRAQIIYGGVNTNPGDLMTFGDGTNLYTDLDVRGFVVGSSTLLTGGAAVRVRKYINVEFDLTLNGGGKLYNGAWFDNTGYINLHSSRFYCTNINLSWSGGAELHCNHAWFGGQLVSNEGTGIGIHVGGGCGGFYSENLMLLYQDIGLLVDTELTGTENIQFFFSKNSTFDSCRTAGVKFNDNISNPISKVIYADAWFCSTTSGHGFIIENWKDGSLHSSSGVFNNSNGNGLVINDPSVTVVLGRAVDISRNYYYGIQAGSPTTIYSDAIPVGNPAGKYGANISIKHPFDGTVAVVGNTISTNFAFGETTAAAGTIAADTGYAGARIAFYGTTSVGGGALDIHSGGSAPISFKTDGTERMRIADAGAIMQAINVSQSKTPASATATGTTGDICWDSNYIYVCVSTNTWKRSSLASW